MKNISVSTNGSVCVIKLNNPQKNNPLNEETCWELVNEFDKIENDQSIKVVVLTGEGKSFSAGGDIKEFSERLEESTIKVYEGGKATAELFKIGTKYTKPIIGAVNGYALGGGLGLTCMCHIVYASEKAQFGATEIKLGLFPFVIMPLVRKIVGERKALELGLTGRIFDANEAKELGVVNYVVPHEKLMDETMIFAQQLAKRSPVAIKMGLTGYNETYLTPSGKAIDYLNTMRVVNFKSKDLHEGALAFLEKRDPHWRGE